MTRLLVTGAAGFIGSAVVAHLAQEGHFVRALVRQPYAPSIWGNRVEVLVGNILDESAMKEAAVHCDVIVHLAGKAHTFQETETGRKEYEKVNFEGTRNVLEGAASAGVRRVIFASSVKVFGEVTTACVDESHLPEPKTPYAQSKWMAEQLLMEYGEQFKFDTMSLRLPLVYGPCEKGNLYRMLAAIDQGWFPPLPILDNCRSMLHIENLLQAMGLVIRADAFCRPCYIVADLEPYCVTALYDSIRQGLGKPLPSWRAPLWALKFAGRCGDVIETAIRAPSLFNSSTLEKLLGSAWYSGEAISRELNYQARRSFDDALPDLIATYRARPA